MFLIVEGLGRVIGMGFRYGLFADGAECGYIAIHSEPVLTVKMGSSKSDPEFALAAAMIGKALPAANGVET